MLEQGSRAAVVHAAGRALAGEHACRRQQHDTTRHDTAQRSEAQRSLYGVLAVEDACFMQPQMHESTPSREPTAVAHCRAPERGRVPFEVSLSAGLVDAEAEAPW